MFLDLDVSSSGSSSDSDDDKSNCSSDSSESADEDHLQGILYLNKFAYLVFNCATLFRLLCILF
jgi:hypothetical protein